MRTDRLSEVDAPTGVTEARPESTRPFLGRALERPAMGLAGIVLLGLLLRLILFAVGWGHASRFLAVDSHQYLRVGQDFGQAVVHGRGPALNFSVYRPPGYPAFIALVHLLSPSLRLLILAQIVLSVVTIVVVYRITALLFD